MLTLNKFLHGDRKRILENILWLLLDRGVRIIIGLAIGVWLARYLGPTYFGKYSYAIALITLLTPLASLGLENIVVRDFILNPQNAGKILGTVFIMQLISGALSILAAYTILYWLRSGDSQIQYITAILSLSFLTQSCNVIKYWHQAQITSKYVVRTQILALCITSLLRVVCIVSGETLETFAWLVIFESFLVSAGLIYRFVDQYKMAIKFSFSFAISILRQSWPLMLSGFAITAYMRIDQVMLGEIQGDEAVGLYSAALTISEGWYFVPVAIAASAFPKIITTRKENEAAYQKQIQNLISTVFFLSLAVCILVACLSSPLINLLYGQSYSGADAVLRIHAAAGVFVAVGVASGRWYINEGLQFFQLCKTITGALTNVVLNFILIPSHGPVGAAIASIISYCIADYISDAMLPSTRPMFYMKSRAIFLGFR